MLSTDALKVFHLASQHFKAWLISVTSAFSLSPLMVSLACPSQATSEQTKSTTYVSSKLPFDGITLANTDFVACQRTIRHFTILPFSLASLSSSSLSLSSSQRLTRPVLI